MHILNNKMSHYTCTKCGKVKIERNGDEKADLLCCDGDKLVPHVLGKVKVEKPTPKSEQKAPTPTTPENKLGNNKLDAGAAGTKLPPPPATK